MGDSLASKLIAELSESSHISNEVSQAPSFF